MSSPRASSSCRPSCSAISLHGLPPNSFNGTLSGFLDSIRGEDRANVEALLKEAMHAQAPFRARYRTPQRRDLDECWLEATGTVIVEGGKAKGMSGLCYDITGRVNLENELRHRAKQQERQQEHQGQAGDSTQTGM